MAPASRPPWRLVCGRQAGKGAASGVGAGSRRARAPVPAPGRPPRPARLRVPPSWQPWRPRARRRGHRRGRGRSRGLGRRVRPLPAWWRERTGPDAPRGHGCQRRVLRRRRARVARRHPPPRPTRTCGRPAAGQARGAARRRPGRGPAPRRRRRRWPRRRDRVRRRADRRADAARDGGEQRAALRTREAPVGHGLTASGADDRTFGHRSPRQPPRALGGPIACQTSGAGSSPHSGHARWPPMAPSSAARRRSRPRAARRRPRRQGRDRRSRAPRTPRPR